MIRVLVADDSPVIRRLMKIVLDDQPDISVVAEAVDGQEAVTLAQTLRPDVVVMDVFMPVLDGLQATAQIMQTSPRPIVIVSSAIDSASSELALKALGEGAVAIVAKASLSAAVGLDRLIDTVRAMAGVKVITRTGSKRRASAPEPPAVARPRVGKRAPRLVAVVVSTGGPQALSSLATQLPPLAVPTVIVQHIASGFTAGFARWLDSKSAMPVTVTSEGELLLPGHMYIAGEGANTTVVSTGDQVVCRLEAAAPDSAFCPSGNALMMSVAANLPGSAVGVVMTGMGDDGAAGLLQMRLTGCVTLAQDSASSVIDSIAKAALSLQAVDRVVPLGELGVELVRLAGTK